MNDALVNLKERIVSALSLATQSEEAAADILLSANPLIKASCPQLFIHDTAAYTAFVGWYLRELASHSPPRTWRYWEACLITIDALLQATISGNSAEELAAKLSAILRCTASDTRAEVVDWSTLVCGAMAILNLPLEPASLVSFSAHFLSLLGEHADSDQQPLTDYVRMRLVGSMGVVMRQLGWHVEGSSQYSLCCILSDASRWWCCDLRTATACGITSEALDVRQSHEFDNAQWHLTSLIASRLPTDGVPRISNGICGELSRLFIYRGDTCTRNGDIPQALFQYQKAIEIVPNSPGAASAAGNVLQLGLTQGRQDIRDAALGVIERWVQHVLSGELSRWELDSSPLPFSAIIFYDALMGQRATGLYVDALARVFLSPVDSVRLVLLLLSGLAGLNSPSSVDFGDALDSALPSLAAVASRFLTAVGRQPAPAEAMALAGVLMQVSRLRIFRRRMHDAIGGQLLARTASTLVNYGVDVPSRAQLRSAVLLAAVTTLLNIVQDGAGDLSEVHAILRKAFPAFSKCAASYEPGTVENLTLSYLSATQQWTRWAEFAESCVEASNRLGWSDWLRERESARPKLENVVSEWAVANLLMPRSDAELDSPFRGAFRRTTETVWRALEALHADRFVTALGPLATVGERLKRVTYNLLGGRKDEPQQYTRIATRQDVAASLFAGEGLLYWHVNDECACFLGIRGEDDATYGGTHTLEDVYDELQGGRVALSELVANHCKAIRNAHDQCTAADLDDERYAHFVKLQRVAYRELGVILGELPNMLEFLKGLKRLFVVVPRELQAVPMGPLPVLWITPDGGVEPMPLAEVVDEVRVVVNASQVYHARQRGAERTETERVVCRGGRLDLPLRPEAVAAIDAAASGLDATRVELMATRPATDVVAEQPASAPVTLDQLLSKPRFALAVVVAHSDQRAGRSRLLCLDGFDEAATESLLVEDPRGRFTNLGPDAAVLLVCNGGELESFAHVLALRSCSTVVASPVKLANPHVMALSTPSVLNALHSSDWSRLVRAIRQSMQQFTKHNSPESGEELARIHYVQSVLPSQLYAVQLYGVPTSGPR